jgi:hypothetical protein
MAFIAHFIAPFIVGEAMVDQPELNPRSITTWFFVHARIADEPAYLFRKNIKAVDCARFAFHANVDGATADVTVGCEFVGARAGIDDQFDALTAKRAVDCFAEFHGKYGAGVQITVALLSGFIGNGRSVVLRIRSQVVLGAAHLARSQWLISCHGCRALRSARQARKMASFGYAVDAVHPGGIGSPPVRSRRSG